MDDPTLLHTYVRERSEPAFAELVARYLPLVHAAALRRLSGDEHRAREVTQMVFTELARKAAKLLAHPALAAWLHQSTRWHASNLLRSERRRAHHEHAAAEHLSTVDAPDPSLEWDALRPVLDAALDALRETDREAVLQRFVMDRPFAAIGEKLGVSENAARMRVDRALDTLRGALARHGITSTTAALALVLTQHVGATTPVGVSSTAIASTACQAAAGAAAAGATGALVTKILLGLSTSAAAALSIALWQQEANNDQLARELAAIRAHAPIPPTPAAEAAPPAPAAPVLDAAALRQIEDDILAAAELAVPLNADQQERVRLDTMIRKGELDSGYAMLFRQLHLPAQQLDTLKTLLVERNQAIYDARQLAKEEGVTFATLSEQNEVLRAATDEIDRRIASALGAGVAASLQEYEDLRFFLGVAGIARTNQRTYSDPVDDKPVLTLARRLRDASPDFPDLVFGAKGWDVETPQAAIDTVASVLGQEVGERFAAQSRARTVRTQLAKIARDAILAGKLSTASLSKGIAREYDAALARQKEPVAP